MENELAPAERTALAARNWYDRQQKRGERLDHISQMLYVQLGAIYGENNVRYRDDFCSTCDVDGHRCGGCGHPVPHGDGPVDYSNHGPGCPGFEAWHLEQSLADYALGVVSEWMRIIELERLPGQPRVTWQDAAGTFILGERPLGDEYGTFRLKITVETLPPPPPIGPENDPAQIEEMWPGSSSEEAEEAATGEDDPQWVPRTWADVRKGDRVRLPGTEHVAEVSAAIHSRHFIHPASDRYNVIPADWSSVTVTLAGKQYQKDPAKPIEIELSPSEVSAIELLGGWSNREGIITAPKPHEPLCVDKIGHPHDNECECWCHDEDDTDAAPNSSAVSE